MSGLHKAFISACCAAVAIFISASASADGGALLGRSLASGEADLRVDGCGFAPTDVTRFVLLGQPFKQRLRFGPGCDFDGEVGFDTRPSRVDLRVRHLGAVSRVTGYLTAVGGLVEDSPFGFTVDLTDGQLVLGGDGGRGAAAEISAECGIGFAGILSIGRTGVGSCRVRATRIGGQESRLNQRLVFTKHHD